MTHTEEYTMTGFMPSGNPFSWYYDENKHCAFTTSRETQYWKKAPQKGDKVAMTKTDDRMTILKVTINGETVYEFDKKQAEAIKKMEDSYWDNFVSERKKLINNDRD